MTPLKCLTCRSIINEDQKLQHTKDKNHTCYLEFTGELTPQKWTKSLLNDEMAGMRTMKIKKETLHLLKQISTSIEAATFDIVISKALEALLREQQDKEYEFEEEKD